MPIPACSTSGRCRPRIRPLKIKMVPSDYRSASLIAGMHGTEQRIEKRRTLRPLAPRRPFSPATASTLEGAPLASLRWDRYARAGVSLARGGFRLREFRSGVNVSRLSLRSLTFRLARPFGLSAPRPAAGSPQPAGRIHASNPLRFYRSVRPTAPPISTPLQEFLPPSGSKRSTDCPAFRSAFRTRPIFVRSPRRPIII